MVSAFGSLVQTHPNNNDLARVMIYLVNHPGISARAAHGLNLLEDQMKAPAAVAYSNLPTRIGEPIVLKGVTLRGAEFSTTKWKGKVVMADFWATWCPYCRDALPEVIANYQEYHQQGFEILGVSSDSKRTDLTAFLAQQRGMVWPQLFTASDTGSWHPLTKKLGINLIPTVLLIDRNGILRERESGRPLRKKLIEKLLAESVDNSVATPAKGNGL